MWVTRKIFTRAAAKESYLSLFEEKSVFHYGFKIQSQGQCYTVDLKNYSQPTHLKNIAEFGFQKREIVYLIQHEGKAFRVV